MLPARDAGAAAPPPGRAPWRAAPLAVLAAVAVVVAAAWALAWRAADRELRTRRARALASVVALKVDQVVRWRDERMADAQVLAHDPHLVVPLATGEPASGALRTWLDEVHPIGDYTGVALVDASGRVASAAGTVDAARPPSAALVADAVTGLHSVASDVEGPPDAPHIDFAAPAGGPLGGAAARAPGVVLLRADPRPYLFRVVATWNEPTRSAEVLLLRPDGGGAVALDGARSGEDRARFPAGGAIAAAVARREAVELEAPDHRGVPVIGAVAPVPGSPWSVLAKEDAADTRAPLRERALTIGVALLGLLVAAGTTLVHLSRRQADRLARATAERAALARRVARLTSHAHDMVFVADEHQRLVDANDRALALLGYARDELVGMEVRSLRDPATLDDYPARVREQVTHGAGLFETRFRRKDGSTFPVAVSVTADDSEGRRRFEAIARDISDRERVERALRDSEARFRAAFEFASLGIALIDPDGRIVETNRALRDMTGWSEDALRGQPTGLLQDPANPETSDELRRKLVEDGVERLERTRRLRRNDGTLVDVVVRWSVTRDDAGRVLFFMALVEDLSEKKRLEAQLLLADRMASVGTLAAGVAHEINNPLSFILSNLDFAVEELRRTGADPEVLRALDDARDGGARVREIVRDLKTFSRPAEDVREALDVRTVLQSAIGLASNEIRHRAQLVVEPGDVPPVAASENRLGQVFVNLLVNAAQAIPEGHVAANVVRATTSTGPDGRAVVEISDTGAGIAPEILPRIFDPFFTTKPVGVGTGLGLSICHGLVAQLGGEISVTTAPGKGSTFRVVLPPTAQRAPRPPPGAPRPVPLAEPASQRRRVLVVDDEPLVGRAVARVLSGDHDVVTRTSAREALQDLLGADPFDLVLCDLQMPEMTGMELHARLAREAPAVAARMLFLTGGAFTQEAREFLERVPNGRIEKPFEPQALRAAVAAAIAGGPRPAPAGA